jgi:hypothetical protein
MRLSESDPFLSSMCREVELRLRVVDGLGVTERERGGKIGASSGGERQEKAVAG